MFQPYLSRFQDLVFHPDPRVSQAVVIGVSATAAIFIALYVAILGPMFALAGAIALVGAALTLRSTHWGLASIILVITLLPFAALPVRIGFTPTLLDLALGVTFFVWLARLITNGDRKFITSPVGGFVAVFIGVALFAFALGLSHSRPTPNILRQFVEIIIGISLFFVVVNTMRRPADVTWLVRWLILGGTGTALIAVVMYVIPDAWTVRVLDALGRFNYPGGYGALRYIEDDPENPMRAIGTAIDPNVLGGMMVILGGMTVPQIFSRRPVLPRWILVSIVGVMVLCLYWTYSRSALLGLAASVGLLAVLKYRTLLLIGGVGAVLLAVLPQTQFYVLRLLEGLRGEDRATLMRFGEYQDSLTLIQRYPWFGVGFSGTPDIDLYLGVSSVYLLMAEEMGLVGLSIFLLTILVFFNFLWRGWQRGLAQGREAVLLGLAGALIGALVAGVFDHYLFNLTYPHMTALFWLCVGLAVATVLVEWREQDRVHADDLLTSEESG